jgi:hypothetical protein
MCLDPNNVGPPWCPEKPLELQGATTATFISVTNATKVGTKAQRVRHVASWIRENVDADCRNWLAGAGTAIDSLLGDPNELDTVLIGVGEFSTNTVSAFTGNDPRRTNLSAGYAMAINVNGAFFNSQVNVGGQMVTATVGGWLGGSNQAQVFILLHELGHHLSAAGFRPDFGDAAAGSSNDALVRRHCGKTVTAAGRMR